MVKLTKQHLQVDAGSDASSEVFGDIYESDRLRAGRAAAGARATYLRLAQREGADLDGPNAERALGVGMRQSDAGEEGSEGAYGGGPYGTGRASVAGGVSGGGSEYYLTAGYQQTLGGAGMTGSQRWVTASSSGGGAVMRDTGSSAGGGTTGSGLLGTGGDGPRGGAISGGGSARYLQQGGAGSGALSFRQMGGAPSATAAAQTSYEATPAAPFSGFPGPSPVPFRGVVPSTPAAVAPLAAGGGPAPPYWTPAGQQQPSGPGPAGVSAAGSTRGVTTGGAGGGGARGSILERAMQRGAPALLGLSAKSAGGALGGPPLQQAPGSAAGGGQQQQQRRRSSSGSGSSGSL